MKKLSKAELNRLRALPEKIEGYVVPDGHAPMVGDYVKKLEDFCIAGVVAQMSAWAIGLSGIGKTVAAHQVAKAYTGSGDYFSIAMMKQTSPARITGGPSVQGILDGEPNRIDVKGTMMDPEMSNVAVIDELSRGGAGAVENFVLALDQTHNKGKIALATDNHMIGVGDSVFDALRSRFGLFWFMHPVSFDIRAVMEAHVGGLPLAPTSYLPTMEECFLVQKAANQLSETAQTSVMDVIERVTGIALQSASKTGEDLSFMYDYTSPLFSPRLVMHLYKIVSRLSVFYTGATDFDTVPAKAINALRWGYPVESPEMQDLVVAIVEQAVDAGRAIVNSHLSDAFTALKAVAALRDEDQRRTQSANIAQRAVVGIDGSQAPSAVSDKAKKLVRAMMTKAASGKEASFESAAPKV